ncbi:FadR family transcriptional regulator [Aeromicrobium sp. A1-2]|uniref:FadR/GntR family transcriptional regulator n=1 Tax=Aeromicrobium sp. A1-2 TaxID=2107713 RepID=UPI000E520F81|nr:GntR family transcriptional regulator [Aeromicrobium sp. A1-2]AXT86351.1 FadR family transcriptional regulator [Aeromicrobium sp. A1-2]
MALTPVSRIPLSLDVAQQLRAAILDNSFPADSELPTESELAASFGVGRSTVREALRVLQSTGLISGADSTSTARPRVTHGRTADSAALALSTAVQVGSIPLEDLVALRVLLESESMRSNVGVPDAARECLSTMDEAAARRDADAFHLADIDFHVSLAHAGGNKALGFVIAVLRDSIAGHLLEALRSMPDLDRVLDRLSAEHHAIVDALDANDREHAAALVVAHIQGFYGPETS